MRISDVIAAKALQETVTITPEASVRELIALLARHNIGAAVVSNDGVTVVGIVSERDVVRGLDADADVVSATVGSIMTADVQVCAPGDSLDEVRNTMTTRRFRHLPVVDEGRLVGLVSIGDVVKSHIDQVEFERDQLDHYVHQN
jgi:CBS domain-containing protein